jgi:hypothetical protein
MFPVKHSHTNKKLCLHLNLKISQRPVVHLLHPLSPPPQQVKKERKLPSQRANYQTTFFPMRKKKHHTLPNNSSEASSSQAPSAPTSDPKTCANCSKAEQDPEEKPLKPCTSCKSVFYCSRDCTKAHYKVHKKECAKLAQEYSKTANFRPAVRTSAPKEGFKGGLQKWQFDT